VLTVTDDPDRSPWFRFGAYDLTLPREVAWDLRVMAASVDLDLRMLRLTSMRVEAATGRVVLGVPEGEAAVTIAGNLEVSVRGDVPVSVAGTTRVPDDWTVEDGVATGPADGSGWRIVVESGSVRIMSR
jgi:hypothetical protein